MQYNKNKIVHMNPNPKSMFEIKENGKGCWVTRQLPGQPEKKYEIEVSVKKAVLDNLEVTYKKIFGKIVSVLSRMKEGKNNYVDKELGIIIEFFNDEQKQKIEVYEIKPLHFINEDGFKVEVLDKNKNNK